MSACAVIVIYRTGPPLAECLRAVGAERAFDEIVLVDNGATEEEAALIDTFASEDARVRVLRGHGNVGFGAGCNRGARQAQSDVLVFVNPDVLLAPDGGSALVEALMRAPRPAIVGGDLRDSAGAPERGSRRDQLTLWRAFVSYSRLSRLEPFLPLFRDFNRHSDPMPSEAAPVDAVSGALFVVRRADFNSIGGFDEGYFLHVEDLDICRRAKAAGWRVLFQPGPHGVHLRSSSDVDPGVIAHHKATGVARYLNKYARTPLEGALSALAGRILLRMAPGPPPPV